MKKFYLFGLFWGGVGFASLTCAQMSTFPALVALEPPSKDPSYPAAHSLSTLSAVPDFGITNQLTSGTPADSTPSSTGAKANTIPLTAEILTSMAALDDKVTLQPGDRISFRVIEDKDLAVPRIVTHTGEVDFPYIGCVKVGGRTCHQVAVELKRLLEVNYYKQATVIVGLDFIANQDKNQDKIQDFAWVVGQVREIGPQELAKAQPMTVSQIILRAGGFGDFADQRNVKVIHRSSLSSPPTTDTTTTPVTPDVYSPQDVQIVDIKAVFDAKSNIDPIVKPNDYIIVPKRLVNF